MRNIKAFTLIEVMVSIFIFSTAMLGYMAFHAHSMSVLFDNESAQFAQSLAFNLVDEINAMSADSFDKFKDAFKGSYGTYKLDKDLSSYFSSAFQSSPFNSFGEKLSDSSTASYRFYRKVLVDTYSNKTKVNAPAGSYLATLYHVEVYVVWPKKEYPNQDCSVQMSSDKCNTVLIPLVRSNRK